MSETYEGFNTNGFRDIELPAGLNQLGSKRLKISQYCPAMNENSESSVKSIFSNLLISAKSPDGTWQNLSFSIDDLELLQLRVGKLLQSLLNVGGATCGKGTEGEGKEAV